MIIFGKVTGSGNSEVRIEAFDIDFRSRQSLGVAVLEPGEERYRIEYGSRQFARAEKKGADILVRAVDREGRVHAESEVLFNAPNEARVDLEFRSVDLQPRPNTNEYDDLIADIAPLIGDADPRTFTGSERHFLAQECLRVTSSFRSLELADLEAQLEALWLADGWAHKTGINRIAFYGWLRIGVADTLDALLASSSQELADGLRRAIELHIIPDIGREISGSVADLADLRVEMGADRQVVTRLRLFDAASGELLAHRSLTWTVVASDVVETAVTDGRGLVTVRLVVAAGDDVPATELMVTVTDDSGAEAIAAVVIPPEPPRVIDVRFSFGAAPAERLRLVDMVGEDAAEPLSDAGVQTVSDLFDRTSDLPEGADRAIAAAKLAMLGSDLPPAARDTMLDDGLTGPADIAALPRDTFLRRYARLMETPDDAFTYYVAALNASAAVGHQIGGARLALETTPGDGDPPDIPEDVTEDLATLSGCGCEECLSAVSPAAYLAQLIDWVLTHLRSNGQEVTLAELVRDLHQPFDELPASCGAVETEERQVRLVVEVLWRFLGMSEAEDLDMPTGFRLAYREVRNRLYHAILANLGADHDRLRIAVSQGDGSDSDLVSQTRAQLAAILGIAEDRLDALWFDTDQQPVSPSEALLQQLFGYRDTRGDPFVGLEQPDLITWQRETLEAIWADQDWVADSYSGAGRLPFVDPALIGAGDLRSGVAGDGAFDLLVARQGELEAHRASAEVVAPPGADFAGYDALLQSELGQGHAELSELVDAIAVPEEEGEGGPGPSPADALATLNLDPGALAHLVAFGVRLAEGDNEEIAEEAWSAVYDILSRAHRIGLHAAWVAEEDQEDITLGATLFAPSVEPPPLPSQWIATAAEREAWLVALAARNAPPIIDPDLFPQYFIMTLFVAKPFGPGQEEDAPEAAGGIAFGDALTLVQPPLEPLDLWQERRDFIDARLSAISDARQGAATRLDAIVAMMAASTAGIDLDTLDALDAVEAEGRSVEAELARLSFDSLAYRALIRIVDAARADVNVTVDELDAVAAMLVQTEKKLLFAAWRGREAELEITLHPATFKILSDPADYAAEVASPWLHDTEALSAWLRRLDGRQSQLDAIKSALAEAVSAAEEVVLPQLRNILIGHSAGDGSVSREASRLGRRLLMDMAMDGCQMTTRVAFAFETLQALIRGTYNQEHRAPLDMLSLDSDADYEADWPVIGNYPAWRGHMLIYLFPESILHVMPHPRQTEDFTRLIAAIPNRLGPREACDIARAYGDYLNDITGLNAAATCQALTRVSESDPCVGSGSTLRSLVHVFGHARDSGHVYWAHYEGFPENKDTLSSWRQVPHLSDVTEIVGAVEHLTPEDRRLLLLFVKTRPLDRTRLQMVQLDLDALNWSKVFDLDLPPGAQPDLTIRAVQKRRGSADFAFGIGGAAEDVELPTVLAFRTPEDLFYVRALNRQAGDWSGSGWMPLLGLERSRQFSQLCALVQRNQRQYVMIVRHDNGYLYYREFWVDSAVGRDDGHWRAIAQGSFDGAFTWPDTQDIFVFYHRANGTHYALIDVADPLLADGFPTVSLHALNGWLISVAGVDLRRFVLDFIEPYDRQRVTGYPTDPSDLSDALGNPAFLDERVLLGYEGDLLALLTNTASDEDILGYLNSPRDELEAMQARGLSIFREFMADAKNEPFTNNQTRDWRVADLIVRQMFSGRGLFTVIERIFEGEEETRPLYRGFQTEAETVSKVSSDRWHVLPSGGDEESAPTARKAVVLRTPDGTFRMKIRRSGNDLSTPKLHRIVLASGGPTDLAPLRRRDALVLRKSEIKTGYQANLGAPASVAIYLREAYNHLPIRLGQALQQNGNFDEALLWYRQVFDYLQKPGSRRIDHGLVVERTMPLDYEGAEAFLDEPENAHAIAETRRNSYTRHVLLLIIQCLIEQADTLFSTDTSNGLARARELYLQALRWLDAGVLRPGESRCDAIIGTLEIDLPDGALDLTQFKAVLLKITDPDELDLVVSDLRAVASDTNSTVRNRIERLRARMTTTVATVAPPQTVARVRDAAVARRGALETAMLANPVQRRRFTGTALRRSETARDRLAAASAVPSARRASPAIEAILTPDEPAQPIPEFQVARFNPRAPAALASLAGAIEEAPLAALSYANVTGGGSGGFGVGGVTFSFCIPQNPLLLALEQRARTNLEKLRSCRNIAGLVRTSLPYDGPIGIGAGAVAADGSFVPSVLVAPTSVYTYAGLIERAKELIALAQQMEASYRAALESAEAAALTEMSARHAVDSAQAQVGLRTLGLEASQAEFNLAEQQVDAKRFQVTAYARRLAEGKSSYESEMLKAYKDAALAKKAAKNAEASAKIAGIATKLASVGGLIDAFTKAAQAVTAANQISFLSSEQAQNSSLISAEARAQAASVNLSFEQRTKDLQLRQSFAAQDVLVAEQQVAVAEVGVDIARAEIRVARLAQSQAQDILSYLELRAFTEGTYRWIASVLGSVYRFFLQEGETLARLAENQLAFETASAPKKIIGTGYWSLPRYNTASAAAQDLGLTGSARLLEDVYRLDQTAFLGRQRKQQQAITLDLDQLFPLEFQRFRETGKMVFETTTAMLERSMPGSYLCTIEAVQVSFVGLVSPVNAIRGALLKSSLSRVVAGGTSFGEVILRGTPERLALTEATTTTGPAQGADGAPNGLRRFFEGSGFATEWGLDVPKEANSFDYRGLATVLVTVVYSALHSETLADQIRNNREPRLSFEKAYSLRQDFPDAWYDLRNPDLTPTPMQVQFTTSRDTLPPNLSGFALEAVVLYVVRRDGEAFELELDALTFRSNGAQGDVGGAANTVDGRVSTRAGNGTSWLSMLGSAPAGRWTLALPDTPATRALFDDGLIEDILLVLSIDARH